MCRERIWPRKSLRISWMAKSNDHKIIRDNTDGVSQFQADQKFKYAEQYTSKTLKSKTPKEETKDSQEK